MWSALVKTGIILILFEPGGSCNGGKVRLEFNPVSQRAVSAVGKTFEILCWRWKGILG